MTDRPKLTVVPDSGQVIRPNDRKGGGGDNGGGGTGDSGLEKRVEALEKALPDLRERLVRVETRLERMATTDDLRALKGEIATELHKALNDQTWRVIGAICVIAGLAFTAAKYIS